MKTRTTLAALLLAAVMVTPSYGAELFIEGAEDYYHDENTHAAYYFMGVVKGRVEVGVGLIINDHYFGWDKMRQLPDENVVNYLLRYPEEVTNGQLWTVVAKYVHDHPEEHHLSSSTLTKFAVEKAWPYEGQSYKNKYPMIPLSDAVIREKTAEEKKQEREYYRKKHSRWINE